MEHEKDGFHAFMAFIALMALIVAVIVISNVSERKKCESLRRQGVKVYLADALVSQECIVIQRAIMKEAAE